MSFIKNPDKDANYCLSYNMRPKGFFMAAPIHNHPAAVQPQEPVQPLRPTAPLGAGGVGSTLQPQIPPSRDIGYVETFVIFLKNLVVKFFSMISSCFKKAETPPVQLTEAPQPEQAPLQPPEQAPPEPEVVAPAAPRLIPGLQSDVDLLNEFERLSQNERDRIFIRIGQDRRMYWFRQGSDLEAGKAKVYADPQILLRYIVRPS